jgi:ribonucleotide reductase alpha subunit
MTKAADPSTSANSVYHFDDHAIAIAKRQYMQPGDNDVYGMFRRIAGWVAGGEASPELRAKWGESFYDLMASKRFCPGGRVLAGAGTQHGNVLNCFVQGATEHDPSSFEGVMEVARKLALVTKVGGGNGVNLDVYAPRNVTNRRDNAVRGWAYMSVSHPDVEDFIKGLMRPPTMPDGEKTPTTIRNWTKVIYGVVSPELSRLARQCGVAVVLEQPENLFSVPDDMGGIIEAARTVCENAKMGLEPRIDLSEMRHEGAAIKGSGGTSSGPVSFLFEIFDNFLEWANLGAEASGPVATLRYCYAPVLRVVRQGGCLHPDTLVNTSRGTLRLRELVDSYSYGHQQHQLQVATDEGWKDSLEGWNNGLADTLKITLENGFELQGTLNHKLKVMRANGQRDWVRFDELQAEDYVIQVLDQHTGSPVSLEPMRQQHFNATPISTPETLTEDLAFFLGYFWGDGFVSTGGRIGLCAAHDSVMMQRVPEMFQELFGLEVSRQQKPNDKSAVFVVKSAALTSWLEQNGLLKGKAAHLELPRAIRQAPRQVLAAFLRGLFEADGGISEHYPYLSSASKPLVQDLAVMLGGLGIPARISTYAPREDRFSKREHYRLRVETSTGLAHFIERIGSIAGSRFETLRDHTPDQQRASTWPLPHAQALLEPIFKTLPAGRKNHPSEYTGTRKTLSRYMRGERQLTATGLARLHQNAQIAETLPEVNQDEYYVPVRSIEQGERILTLDICVEDNHTYLANGIVSHNTRRGAGMATISIDHPDVLDFLTAKDLDRESAEGDISTFNISILATERFWNVLQDDGLWEIQPLEVPAKYHVVTIDDDYTGRWPDLSARALDGAKAVPLYNTPTGQVGVPATWIWRQIAEHAWSTGEPGLIFNDRVNEMSALKNLGPKYEIKSTNPCVTGDTMIAVADGRGAVSFRELTEAGVDVPVYAMDHKGRPAVRWMRNPRVTGYKQAVYQITFDDGLKVRVTGNHKFNLTDSTFKEVLELQPGDSVASMTRFHATFDEAVPALSKTRSQNYVWLTTGKGLPIGEHRLIAAFQRGKSLEPGLVVHHRDYDALNNHPDNLEVMTHAEHDRIHREHMLGDNNPMRDRWWGQLSDAEKDAYRARMAASTGGERNGRFSGASHIEILEAARDLARTLGRGFTRPEWHAHAAAHGLPQSLSSYRKEELGSVQDLSSRVAAELGLPVAPRGVGRSRHFARNLQLFKSALESGYASVRHDGDFYPIVTRACECCGTHYEMPWDRREVSFCRPCGLKKASEMGRDGARAAMRRISENTVERQVRAYNDLKFTLGRRPWKTEWEKHCKDAGVPVRLHNGGVPTYTDLEQRASVANHRVVSVEFDGYEDVYNGTVDEFHNYYIGHHELSANDDKPRVSYVNTRQCGEIPLTVGEPCDLGAINLAAYVKGSSFDFNMFRKDVRDCIRFLDDVLEVNVFALEDNRVASHNLRRLGLGVMGLADALIKLGLRYDRQDGRDMIDEIMTVMREESILESEALGVERGVYPVYAQNAEKMPHRPRRNVAVLTVAPTGTTSMLMGVSSGIEPVFSPFIWRKIGADYKALIAPLFQELLEQFPAHPQYAREGRWDWDKVTDALSGNHGSCVGLEFVPEVVQSVFVCAHDIEPMDHVRMQGTVQRAFDAEGYAANSLSKTINLPNEATVEEIEDAYTEAYRTGCKGITVYRDGSRQFQVLSTSKDEKKEEKSETLALAPSNQDSLTSRTEHGVPSRTEHDNWHVAPGFQPGKPIMERPARLTGVTDMVKLTDLGAGSKRTFLITTNTHEGSPVEIVVVSGRAGDEANADSEALGRVVSIALQYGVPVEAIQKTLRGINGGLYGSYNGRLVASKADLIAVALESTASGGKVVPAEQALLYPVLEGAAPSASELDNQVDVPLFKNLAKVEMKGERCPSCSSNNMIREEGCLKCLSCGYSKCG